jgi:DNA-binding transcriptional MerR regulator
VTIGIGELAQRTGLTPQALRAWETRFGFPEPARSESGRRAYAEEDVDRVHRVLALKQSGVRVAEAIARVRDEQTAGPHSIYATLRRRHPELPTRRLHRAPLVAISRAIEDETMSRVERPVVFGAFQQEEFFRQSERRWTEIARTAASCLVFADFARARRRDGGPFEVPLAPDAPLLREWAVVVAAPTLSAVLTAWEVPHQEGVPAHRRAFESTFTFDPTAVRTAVQVCLAAARSSGVVPDDVLATPTDALRNGMTPSRAVDSLVLRAFDYLQHA